MKTSELKHALELVRPGLANKKLLEQATSVIFRDGKVWTFNDEVAVVAPLETGITGVVPAEPLYKFLGKLPPDGELKIEEGDGEFRFSSGRNRAGIRRDEDIRLPIDDEVVEPDEWWSIPDGFIKALDRALFSCAQGGHRPILTCVHITQQWIESCDGFRMTRVDSSNILDDNVVCLVGRNLERLANYSPTEIGFSGNWLQFRNGDDVRYAVRMIDGDYPDLGRFIEEGGQELELPTNELEKALEWASVVADDSIKYKQHVDLQIQKGRITVKGEGPDGWAEETLRLRYNGPSLSFKANPTLLKEMLSLGSKITVGKESLKIESEGFVHVVSLEVEED